MDKKNILVSVLLGSKSDWEIMKGAASALKEFAIPFEVRIISAHRSPTYLTEYMHSAENRGLKIWICGAGKAAHLAGAVSSHSSRPVIGIPISSGSLNGLDALLSTVQMPQGVPVACVAVNGSYNAGLLAVQILALENEKLSEDLNIFKKNLEKSIRENACALESDPL